MPLNKETKINRSFYNRINIPSSFFFSFSFPDISSTNHVRQVYISFYLSTSSIKIIWLFFPKAMSISWVYGLWKIKSGRHFRSTCSLYQVCLHERRFCSVFLYIYSPYCFRSRRVGSDSVPLRVKKRREHYLFNKILAAKITKSTLTLQ